MLELSPDVERWKVAPGGLPGVQRRFLGGAGMYLIVCVANDQSSRERIERTLAECDADDVTWLTGVAANRGGMENRPVIAGAWRSLFARSERLVALALVRAVEIARRIVAALRSLQESLKIEYVVTLPLADGLGFQSPALSRRVRDLRSRSGEWGRLEGCTIRRLKRHLQSV